MSNLPPGAERHPNAPWNQEEEFTCNVCDTPISRPGICNSKDCFKVDNY